MKKVITFSLFLFTMIFANFSFGQTSTSNNDFVKNSFLNLERQFQKSGSTLKLEDSQKVKLEKIFLIKEEKFNKLAKQYPDKGDFSEAMMKLEKEINAQIEGTLNTDQKVVFRKITTPRVIGQ